MAASAGRAPPRACASRQSGGATAPALCSLRVCGRSGAPSATQGCWQPAVLQPWVAGLASAVALLAQHSHVVAAGVLEAGVADDVVGAGLLAPHDCRLEALGRLQEQGQELVCVCGRKAQRPMHIYASKSAAAAAVASLNMRGRALHRWWLGAGWPERPQSDWVHPHAWCLPPAAASRDQAGRATTLAAPPRWLTSCRRPPVAAKNLLESEGDARGRSSAGRSARSASTSRSCACACGCSSCCCCCCWCCCGW